jgi:hypothetical protein
MHRPHESHAFQPPAVSILSRHRSFSRFATQVAGVAGGWQVYELTGSALALGMIGPVQFSVVIRFSLMKLATPDDMRGRVGAVNFLFINASNQLGQFESGVTAALLGTVPAAVLGGIGTVAVALL